MFIIMQVTDTGNGKWTEGESKAFKAEGCRLACRCQDRARGWAAGSADGAV